MSLDPFHADPAVPARLAALPADARVAIVATAMGAARRDAGALADNMGAVVPGTLAAELARQHGLDGSRDVMRLLVEPARALARAPISDFLVGAVGLERGTGHLILGANVEFPGTHLGLTIHGEGFVATRAFSRGSALEAIAIGEAHPCGHCRQYLSEFSWAAELELIDPLGHVLRLGQLYPWPFDPACLGENGAVAGTAWALSYDAGGPEALLAAGRRAHAPYSGCPGAVMLEMEDGARVVGLSVESVAFNPTMQPVMAAAIEMIAHGYDWADVRGAVLGTVIGGAVDYRASTAEVLARCAPEVALRIAGWRT
jgi:cytidine deaminase